MSHLYGFHPGTTISKRKAPKIFKAIRSTLDFRLKNGGAGTGWSRAWLINCSARLLEGNMANEHIHQLFYKSIYPNLFDAHPPFQIDGNFGYTAGVAEMLVQSHEEDVIRILPALPNSWKNGYIKGIKARGNHTLDIYWKNNKLEKAEVKSEFGSRINLIYNDQKIPIEIKKGDTFTFVSN
jgi:alpha-L-fucosidase 2